MKAIFILTFFLFLPVQSGFGASDSLKLLLQKTGSLEKKIQTIQTTTENQTTTIIELNQQQFGLDSAYREVSNSQLAIQDQLIEIERLLETVDQQFQLQNKQFGKNHTKIYYLLYTLIILIIALIIFIAFIRKQFFEFILKNNATINGEQKIFIKKLSLLKGISKSQRSIEKDQNSIKNMLKKRVKKK